MKEGGTRPNDMVWAANADWDSYMGIVIVAAQMTRETLENRNINDVCATGNVSSYPSYQGCHIKFYPEMSGQSPFISMFIRCCPISNFGRWTPKP